MANRQQRRNIVYRCDECGSAVFGLVGKFAKIGDMLRLKCSCDKPSALDIGIMKDDKIKLSVPCLFCKQNHSYTVSEQIFLEREKFALGCPYTGLDIVFIGDEDKLEAELTRTEEEIRNLMMSLEAEELSDIQPTEMNEDEILPDPAVYDTLRFVVKDLEEEGRISCPCGHPRTELRFCDGGIQVYCEECGASHTFLVTTPSLSEEFLSLDSLELR